VRHVGKRGCVEETKRERDLLEEAAALGEESLLLDRVRAPQQRKPAVLSEDWEEDRRALEGLVRKHEPQVVLLGRRLLRKRARPAGDETEISLEGVI